ncbi:putative rhomboid family protein [Erysiphe neolycopersici]|uniref:Putative rhomboid family protein n=1 Tax=Erysiphe neolycopersici TaxID=212602 RepID=A0A420HME4_9PEZI|nr:putative rhomboid family protein [Erysiphe neolycopersici]
MTASWTTFPRFICIHTPSVRARSRVVTESILYNFSQRCMRSYSKAYRWSFNNPSQGCLKGYLCNTIALSSFKIPTRSYTTNKECIIITEFDQLPDDYDDSKGLAYRKSPISAAEAKVIFGEIIDVGTADRVLRGIHGRRVAGTLEDPLYNNVFEKNVVDKALAWLRENVPVNEDLNAGLRAEKELAEMEADLISDAERIGIYRPNSGIGENVYGDSVIDKIKELNIKKRELEEDQKAKEMEMEKTNQANEVFQNSGLLEIPTNKVMLERREEHPRLKYYRERANVLPDTPPVMTTWQRLWPSGLLMLGVVTCSLVFTEVYIPPKETARIFPEMPLSAATVIGIIIFNSTIFFLWRVPMFWRLLNKYFIMFPGYPRPISLLGCSWSHQSISHLVLNMGLLYFFGTRLHENIGRGNFIALYLSAGTMSNFFSLTCWVFLKNFSSSSLGASGAVIAVMTAFLLCNIGEKIPSVGLFPQDAWPFISATILFLSLSLDLFALRRFHMTGKGLTIDHYGHIGGYLVGALWAYFLSSQPGHLEEIKNK